MGRLADDLKALKPKILLYDIETSYIVAGLWRTYQADAVTVLQDWQILCFAWKWLDDKTVKVVGQDDYDNYQPGVLNDYNVVAELRELFDQADIVVAHNGNSYDQKKAQARMMVHGLQPPSPYQQIDTRLEMKKVAAHTSNRLDDLNRALSLERKIGTGGIATWTGCMNGDPASWQKMKRYNRQDVRALEQLYLAELPWMKTHPSLNVITDTPNSCPRCLSTRLKPRGFKTTKSRKYQRFVCGDCGGWCSSPRSERVEAPGYVA